MSRLILAVDQGTSSTRAMVYQEDGQILGQAQRATQTHYPQPGWVEQCPEAMLQNTIFVIQSAVADAGLPPSRIEAIGLTNQRETVIAWDTVSGQSVYPAIVWQDRRTADRCQALSSEAESIWAKTGMPLDPYFSATKIEWILREVPAAAKALAKGTLAVGTVDAFLLWHLDANRSHLTSHTNACRTLLYDLEKRAYDSTLCERFGIPASILPSIVPDAFDFGALDPTILGVALPITAMVGDQQAATIGQAIFEPGKVKATFGTGCFVLSNTGTTCRRSQHQLLSTIAYVLPNTHAYALEGSTFIAGAAVQWLRDELQFLEQAPDCAQVLKDTPSSAGVQVIPAFTGLGAPFWVPTVKGAILGLKRDSNRQHLIRATLEAIAYQTQSLLDALAEDLGQPIRTLRIDGGMASNDPFMQLLADVFGGRVERPQHIETTIWGAALLASYGAGWYDSLDQAARHWALSAHCEPSAAHIEQQQQYQHWVDTVHRYVSAFSS